jgi:uncharacterized membrane protein YgcG
MAPDRQIGGGGCSLRATIAGLALLWLLTIHAAAAGLPEKQGHVLDTADLFTAEERMELERSVGEGRFPFYIVAVSSLEGREPSEFAEAIYHEWELASGEVLLLIAAEEQWVEMNFDHDGLYERIAALMDEHARGGGGSSATLDEFVAAYFVPYAQKGDFKGAVLALYQAVNEIGAALPDDSGAPGGKDVSVPAANPSQGAERGHSEGRSPIWTAGVILAALAALAAAAALAAGIRMRRQVSQLRTRLSDLMVDVHRAGEELASYVGLAQGTTGELVEQASERLNRLLVQINESRTALNKQNPFVLDYKGLRQLRRRYEQELEQSGAELQHLRRDIERVRDADRQVRETCEKAVNELQKLREELQRMIRETGFPFPRMIEEMDRMQEEVSRAGELNLFDPIEAMRILEQSQTQMKNAAEALRSVPNLLGQYRAFPALLRERRGEIERIARQNGLKLVHRRPFTLLEQAESAIGHMMERLKQGEIHEAGKQLAEADRLLADALRLTEREAALKEKNRRDIELLDAKSREYAEGTSRVFNAYTHAQQTYAAAHWSGLQPELDKIAQIAQNILGELPPIRRWCDEEHQEWEKAREALDRLLAQLREADRLAAAIHETVAGLDHRLETLRHQAKESWDRFGRAAVLAERERLPERERFDERKSAIRILWESLTDLYADRTFDLDELSARVSRFCREADSFAEEAIRLAERKEAVGNEYRRIQAEYRTAANRASARLNVQKWNAAFAAYLEQAKRCWEEGRFSEAELELRRAEAVVHELEDAYRQAVEEERMMEARRRELQRQASHRFPPFGGGGSSGGAGWGNLPKNRSGGASWGGSSKPRRPGGPGPGGSKRNRSGGARW